jgi:hypothetical protein
MRSLTTVIRALLDTIPQHDPHRGLLVARFKKISQSAMFMSPEQLPTLWLRVREALVQMYPRSHPLYPSLARVFAGTTAANKL